MVDDTRNCDEVGAYLEKICPELQGAVLVIHTKNNGEISEAASGKNKEELEMLRKQSNEIDTWKSPYKAIVSVLMLKEGWDVRNVTTIVGLRAYAAKSNILPEQTLGRGLRRMYFGTRHARNGFRHGHARVHGFRRVHPERRRHLRARADGRRRARASGIRWSSKWTRRTRTKTSTRSTSRCRTSPAASTANSKTSTRWTRPPSATQAAR